MIFDRRMFFCVQERRKGGGERGGGGGGRKPKIDPAFLEVEKLTGEENVSVINRVTGKWVRTYI